jgi:5-bromo-4-chloroindolyl phosphate hydrolysis protein
MNKYLTDRATQNRGWHIPVGIVSLLLVAATVEVWIEDSPVGEDFFTWLLAYITVLGAVLLPLYFIVRWRLRKKDAKQIAQKLLKLKETSIPLVELSNKIGMKKADVKVVDLKKHGFLQRIDIEDGKLLLDNVHLIEETKVEDSGTNINDAILHKIRYLNDEIDDEAVSERIDRIERVTASIIHTLEEHPERIEDARRFMNYYLPTTMKLLESYNLMEDQSYQGKNIQAARRRIEDVLDKLVMAAEAQQDKLFRAEAMDVDAEIDALETMMASDGLITR